MLILIRKKAAWFYACAALLIAAVILFTLDVIITPPLYAFNSAEKKYIKWVDFNIPYEVLKDTLSLDVKSYGSDYRIDWIELLAYLGAKYGGNFDRFMDKDLDAVLKRLNSGMTMNAIAEDMKYYNYYHEAFSAVLGGFVGDFKVETDDPDNPGSRKYVQKYGLKAFSPIAKGYGFSHYDDFGNSRSYGWARRHLGNDLMGAVGTPVIAVESGVIEAMGWDEFGGWRVGIRSFDSKRYFYYAHLRKNHPFNTALSQGMTVKAGDVIGYMGMTGYSTKENTNNINTPHLHFGMQLIFDESQKDGANEIWIDVYDIVELLQKNRSAVVKDPATDEYTRKYSLIDPAVPE